MINDYWIVSVFEIECGLGMVGAFRISIGKEIIVNHYWIVYYLE